RAITVPPASRTAGQQRGRRLAKSTGAPTHGPRATPSRTCGTARSPSHPHHAVADRIAGPRVCIATGGCAGAAWRTSLPLLRGGGGLLACVGCVDQFVHHGDSVVQLKTTQRGN